MSGRASRGRSRAWSEPELTVCYRLSRIPPAMRRASGQPRRGPARLEPGARSRLGRRPPSPDRPRWAASIYCGGPATNRSGSRTTQPSSEPSVRWNQPAARARILDTPQAPGPGNSGEEGCQHDTDSACRQMSDLEWWMRALCQPRKDVRATRPRGFVSGEKVPERARTPPSLAPAVSDEPRVDRARIQDWCISDPRWMERENLGVLWLDGAKAFLRPGTARGGSDRPNGLLDAAV
jgi:hypothetical protein